jgi:hypothetical protein
MGSDTATGPKVQLRKLLKAIQSCATPEWGASPRKTPAASADGPSRASATTRHEFRSPSGGGSATQLLHYGNASPCFAEHGWPAVTRSQLRFALTVTDKARREQAAARSRVATSRRAVATISNPALTPVRSATTDSGVEAYSTAPTSGAHLTRPRRDGRSVVHRPPTRLLASVRACHAVRGFPGCNEGHALLTTGGESIGERTSAVH